MAEPTPELSRLDPDEPIKAPSEDRLEREAFVNLVANTAQAAPAEGLVIGLDGKWGEGKTSVINLVRQKLEAEDEPWLVVDFNPWLFEGSQQLVRHFLTELAQQLRGRRLRRLAGLLLRYNRAVGGLGDAPVIGFWARITAWVAGTIAAFGAPDSAEVLRDKLRKRLEKDNRRILVVVDDLDRLDEQELKDVVRLIRLVGDFPRLSYLVAFDREQVELTLGGEQGRAAGAAYLEKVVQVVRPLPSIRPEALDDLLRDRMLGALGDLSRYRFDQATYEAVYEAGFRSLFQTPRDVRRFCNHLMGARAVAKEVELTDVLALEALRLLEPQLFDALIARRDLLAGHTGHWIFSRTEESREKGKIELERAFELAEDPEQMQALIMVLFPGTERFLRNTSYGDDTRAAWRAHQRVAHEEVLEIYLNGVLPKGTLPSREVLEAVAAFDDRDQLRALLSASDHDRLAGLLGRVVDHLGPLAPADPVPALEELLEFYARLPPAEMGDDDMERAVRVTTRRLLERRSSEQLEVIAPRVKTESLSAKATFLRLLGAPAERGRARLISDELAGRLERELAQAIANADPVELVGERDFRHLLWRAEQTLNEEKLARAFEALLSDDRALLEWLSKMCVVGKRAEGTFYQLDWPAMTAHVGQEPLAARIRERHAELAELVDDERGRAALRQALVYADDPAQADRDIAPYR